MACPFSEKGAVELTANGAITAGDDGTSNAWRTEWQRSTWKWAEPEEPSRSDGSRVLVERLWPRGLSKERAAVDLWLKEIAPRKPRSGPGDEIVGLSVVRDSQWTECGAELFTTSCWHSTPIAMR